MRQKELIPRITDGHSDNVYPDKFKATIAAIVLRENAGKNETVHTKKEPIWVDGQEIYRVTATVTHYYPKEALDQISKPRTRMQAIKDKVYPKLEPLYLQYLKLKSIISK